MALESYETALGWLGSGNRKSSIRVFFDYMQLCTGKVDVLKRQKAEEAESRKKKKGEGDQLLAQLAAIDMPETTPVFDTW